MSVRDDLNQIEQALRDWVGDRWIAHDYLAALARLRAALEELRQAAEYPPTWPTAFTPGTIQQRELTEAERRTVATDYELRRGVCALLAAMSDGVE